MSHLIALIVAGVVVVYAAVLLMLWWTQERIVFQPPSRVAPSEVSARRVEYRTADGIELFAYIVGECRPDRTLLLAFHGNADIARWFIPWASVVVSEADACVVLPEYRGYDGVVGRPSYDGSAHDARAALAYVRDVLGVPAAHTVYFGHSLGTAIAAELAAVEPPRSLVLQSPFSTARAMAKRMFLPGLSVFWGIVSRVHFDTLARVRTLAAPVWVAHGDRDLVVPVQMGRDVFNAALERGELLIVPGGGHSDLPERGGRAYWQWLERAIRGSPAADINRDVRARTQSAP